MIKHDRLIGPYEIALMGVLLVSAVLKWRYFCGLVAADDFSYAVYAWSLWRMPMPWDLTMDFRVLRLALLLPVALLLRVLPPTVTAIVAYPMMLSFGTIVLVYLIAKRVAGQNAGLLAAFTIATLPGDVIYGTMFLPDGVVPFYLAMTVWMFLKAVDGDSGKSPLWYGLSGLFMFLAFVTRENTYYFLLFFMPFAFSMKRWREKIWMFGVGFAVPVLLLYSFYMVKSGDFLFNLHLAQHYRDPLVESGYIPPNDRNWFIMLYMMLPGFFEMQPGRRILMSGLFGYSMYFGTACMIYSLAKGIVRKNWKLLIAPWWFILVYLYLDFGSVSFTSFQMMRKLDRFLLTLTPAMAICCGVFLRDALGMFRHNIFSGKVTVDIRREYSKRPFLLPLAIATLVVAGFVGFTSVKVMAYQKENRDNNLAKFRWGYFEVLKNQPNKKVYTTGGWWENKLSFYYLPDMRFADMSWRRSEMTLELVDVTDHSDLAGSHVIIDRSHFTGRNDLRICHSYDDFPGYIKLPPEEWIPLGRKDGVEIYSVPDGWKYVEPDGKQLVRETLDFAMGIGDVMLFLNCFHPELKTRLPEEKYNALVQHMANTADPIRADLLDNHMMYRLYNGVWKMDFNVQ